MKKPAYVSIALFNGLIAKLPAVSNEMITRFFNHNTLTNQP
jgi:hypothetical protein